MDIIADYYRSGLMWNVTLTMDSYPGEIVVRDGSGSRIVPFTQYGDRVSFSVLSVSSWLEIKVRSGKTFIIGEVEEDESQEGIELPISRTSVFVPLCDFTKLKFEFYRVDSGSRLEVQGENTIFWRVLHPSVYQKVNGVSAPGFWVDMDGSHYLVSEETNSWESLYYYDYSVQNYFTRLPFKIIVQGVSMPPISDQRSLLAFPENVYGKSYYADFISTYKEQVEE